MATEKSATPAKKTARRPTGGARKTEPRQDAPRSAARPPTKASKVAVGAKEELVALTGKDAEGVTSLERNDDGWLVRVEVVELRRIPDTTDVLALYEVQTDAQGNLESYKRVRRYVRGVPDND